MIIGVTGGHSSGKGDACEFISKKYDFGIESYGNEVRQEAQLRGIFCDPKYYRKSLQKLGDNLRIENGVNYWSKRIHSKMTKEKNYVIDGLRYVEDVEFFRNKEDFKLVGIYSSFFTRALRTIEKRRSRKEDEISFDEFRVVDKNDRFGLPGVGQQTQACFDKSDYIITNEGSMEELNTSISNLIDKLI